MSRRPGIRFSDLWKRPRRTEGQHISCPWRSNMRSSHTPAKSRLVCASLKRQAKPKFNQMAHVLFGSSTEHSGVSTSCRLPRKQTLLSVIAKSASCHFETHAVQQKCCLARQITVPWRPQWNSTGAVLPDGDNKEIRAIINVSQRGNGLY